MKRNKGFTLIEVLAALIIVGLGMLAAIHAVNQTVNNTNYLRDKSVAHWVAMNKLAETRLNASPPSSGDSDGDVDMAGVTWHWRITVTTMDPTMGIQRIDVKVAPKSAGADATMDTVFGIYGSSFAPSTPTPGWDFNSGPPGSSVSNNGNSSSANSSAASRPTPGPLN